MLVLVLSGLNATSMGFKTLSPDASPPEGTWIEKSGRESQERRWGGGEKAGRGRVRRLEKEVFSEKEKGSALSNAEESGTGMTTETGLTLALVRMELVGDFEKPGFGQGRAGTKWGLWKFDLKL